MNLKELKCKNCGATLEVEEDAKTVTCNFCKTSFSVETNEDIGYQFEKGRIKAQEEQREEMFKKFNENADEMFDRVNGMVKTPLFVKIFIGFIFLFIFGIIVFQIISFVSFDKSFNTNSFNGTYELYSGKTSSLSVHAALDEAITNNKKNKKHIITVVYGDISTTEPSKIEEIEKSIEDFHDYYISLDYDNDGYVNKITIKE